MRDHGGNLDEAMARFGGAAADWLDLSTGINPVPYPVPALPPRAWSALPTRAEIAGLEAVARRAYGCEAEAEAVALAGAQAAIQLVPRLWAAGRARVVGPTYNEHAAALRAEGWDVEEVAGVAGLAGAELGVVVSPNNPDGRRWGPEELRAVAADVGLLLVDESFADVAEGGSMASVLGPETEGLVVLRSFGKFYGLAGVRLGFALTGRALAARLREMAGPWAVSGPAVAIGAAALADGAWQAETRRRLAADAGRLDELAARAGWALTGGTALFRTYETGDAVRARDRLAEGRVWVRAFPYSRGWLRLGLPGAEADWARLEAVLG